MLDPMQMLDVLDEDMPTLQRVLRELDEFIVQNAHTAAYDTALRQREHIHQELSERNASWAVIAPMQHVEQQQQQQQQQQQVSQSE